MNGPGKLSPKNLADEARNAILGDSRLSQRLGTIVQRLAASPGDSFPEVSASDSELEATYRFFNNPKVSWQKILEPHYAGTVQRIGSRACVRVLHDPTCFNFTRDGTVGMGQMRGGTRGFFGRFALAVSTGEDRLPFGLLSVETVFREVDAKEVVAENGPKQGEEMALWHKEALKAQARLPKSVGAIHIMDRAADSSLVLDKLLESGLRFVIRSSYDRWLQVPADTKLRESFSSLETTLLRKVGVSERPVTTRQQKKGRGHPAREARTVTLHVRAQSIAFTSSRRGTPNFLAMNAVQVVELNPPPGEEAIEWLLLTTEPIDTVEAMTAVVDHYCARWVIEEFFKALKTGCAFQKRQLTSARALLNALAVLSPIAWRLLLMRTLSRDSTARPAKNIFSTSELNMLTRISRRVRLGAEPTVREAVLAIAGLGGHLKRNGEPGWITLGRGYDKFLDALTGWNAAHEM